MQKLNIGRIGKSLRRGLGKNNQKILALMAMGCAIGAVVEAIRARKKANAISEVKKESLENLTTELKEGTITTEEYQNKQKEVNWRAAKEYALCYGTSAALLILSLGSSAIGYKVSIGKQAALLGAYKALELKSDEFMNKTKEVLGEERFDEIKSKVVEDRIGNAITTNLSFEGCWEDGTGRPFPGNETMIRQGLIKAVEICKEKGEVSLNQIGSILDPSGRWLPPCDLGRNGFVIMDLVDEFSRLPYRIIPIQKEGYDHPFSAIVWDVRPRNLIVDRY